MPASRVMGVYQGIAPYGALEINKSHPFFQGNYVLVHGEHIYTNAGYSFAWMEWKGSSASGLWRGYRSATIYGVRLFLATMFANMPKTLLFLGDDQINTSAGTAVTFVGVAGLATTGFSLGSGGTSGPGSRRSMGITANAQRASVFAVTAFTDNANWKGWNAGGRQAVTASGSAASYSATGAAVEVGFQPGNGTFIDNRVQLAGYSDVAIPDAASVSLSANPWQLFRKSNILYFDAVSAAFKASWVDANTVISPGALNA